MSTVQRPDDGTTGCDGLEHGFFRTSPYPPEWGIPRGSQFSQERRDWVRQNVGWQAEDCQEILAKKALRLLAIAQHAARIAELDARRDPW